MVYVITAVDKDLTFSSSPILPQAEILMIKKVSTVILMKFFINKFYTQTPVHFNSKIAPHNQRPIV